MKKHIIISTLIIANAISFAQEKKVEKGNKEYEKYAYSNAIQAYEKAAEKGYYNTEMLKKMGNAYYFNANFKEAGKWYAKLFETTSENIEPEYYYRYSDCLKAEENYTTANQFLDKFSEKASSDSRAILYSKNKKYLNDIQTNSGRYEIEDAGINSELSDYGGFIYNNQLIFTSNRSVITWAKRKHSWTNQPLSKLYSVSLGNLSEAPESFSKKLDTRFYESTAVFTKDGNTIYFTRNNYNNGKRGKDAKGTTHLQLYKAELIEGKWKNITALPFNSDDYSTAHPALSTDEKTLYFASDMPGTKGQSDIFKVAINTDGSFGTPVNLGDTVNTEGRETFPFISENNEFYFASDGHPGLGGLDIFVFKLFEDGSKSDIVNIGKPVNSSFDDFAFFIDNQRTGYFSSNREGGLGYDDIYKFKETTPISFITKQAFEGTVTDEKTSKILPNALVELFDNNGNKIGETYTDAKGKFYFKDLKGNTPYKVRSKSTDYETKNFSFTTEKNNGKTIIETPLPKVEKKFKKGDDLAKLLDIKTIYFDLGKWDIRPDAANELEKIVTVMKENPTMKIEVRSHTDSRGSAKSNLKLSDNRAKSTAAWIINQGITEDRITGKGYGESQLINKCADGIKCTEEEHQQNRRSEFIITNL
jgi:outer membrane protein OmpA-like peptidoglycan-associated protein